MTEINQLLHVQVSVGGIQAEDIRTVFRESAATYGSGNYVRQVEYADSRQGAFCLG